MRFISATMANRLAFSSSETTKGFSGGGVESKGITLLASSFFSTEAEALPSQGRGEAEGVSSQEVDLKGSCVSPPDLPAVSLLDSVGKS